MRNRYFKEGGKFKGYATSFEDAPDWLKKELGSTRLNETLRLYACMIIAGRQPKPVDIDRLAYLYRPDQRNSRKVFLTLLKQPLVQAMLNRKIIDQLMAEGMDPAGTVGMMRDAFEVAKKAKDSKQMMAIVDRIIDIYAELPDEEPPTLQPPMEDAQYQLIEDGDGPSQKALAAHRARGTDASAGDEGEVS